MLPALAAAARDLRRAGVLAAAMGTPVTLVALVISVEPLIDMGRTALNGEWLNDRGYADPA